MPRLPLTHYLCQACPVFRVLLPTHLAVGPRHRDETYHAQVCALAMVIRVHSPCGVSVAMWGLTPCGVSRR